MKWLVSQTLEPEWENELRQEDIFEGIVIENVVEIKKI